MKTELQEAVRGYKGAILAVSQTTATVQPVEMVNKAYARLEVAIARLGAAEKKAGIRP